MCLKNNINVSRICEAIGIPFYTSDCCGSTNAEILNYSGECALTAFEQTAGRGRQDRSFISPMGGIYLSIKLNGQDTDLMTVTAKTGLCVVAIAKEILGLDLKIKWLNDVFINNKKVCGILTENHGGELIIGIGINYCTNQSLLPQVAGSLNAPAQLAEDFLIHLITSVRASLKSPFDRKLYKRLCFTLNKTVGFTANGETLCGKAVDISPSAQLIIKTERGKYTLSAGDAAIIEK